MATVLTLGVRHEETGVNGWPRLEVEHPASALLKTGMTKGFPVAGWLENSFKASEKQERDTLIEIHFKCNTVLFIQDLK